MSALQYLKALHFPRRRRLRHGRRQGYAATEHALARFLPPSGQHERMNLEGVGDGLHLDKVDTST